MKLKVIVAIALIALGSTGSIAADGAAARQVDIRVKGMVCGFCAQGLDKKFRAQPAVEDVKVTLKDKLIRVTLKAGQDMTDKDIRTLVEDAGYNVDAIKR